MNLTLQRYHICIALVKYLGNYFQEIPVLDRGLLEEVSVPSYIAIRMIKKARISRITRNPSAA